MLPLLNIVTRIAVEQETSKSDPLKTSTRFPDTQPCNLSPPFFVLNSHFCTWGPSTVIVSFAIFTF